MSVEIKPLKCIAFPLKFRSATGTVIFDVQSSKSLSENLLPRWAQETQNVAAKSVFKMAGGYFPRGGRGQITFLLC